MKYSIPEPKRPFYLTRDYDPIEGRLDDRVEVWSEPPDHNYGTWCHPRIEVVRLERISLASARARFGTIPETDRECVKYG